MSIRTISARIIYKTISGPTAVRSHDHALVTKSFLHKTGSQKPQYFSTGRRIERLRAMLHNDFKGYLHFHKYYLGPTDIQTGSYKIFHRQIQVMKT